MVLDLWGNCMVLISKNRICMAFKYLKPYKCFILVEPYNSYFVQNPTNSRTIQQLTYSLRTSQFPKTLQIIIILEFVWFLNFKNILYVENSRNLT